MKKLIKISFVAVFAAVAGYGIYNVKTNPKNGAISDLALANVESLAACESIGWWDNDGNCVKNDAGTYFCKSDSWPALTDCLQ